MVETNDTRQTRQTRGKDGHNFKETLSTCAAITQYISWITVCKHILHIHLLLLICSSYFVV